MSLGIRSSGLPLLLLFTFVVGLVRADEPLPARIEFNRDIRPILSDICFHCHGPDQAQRKADLRFDIKEGAFADLGEGRKAIVPRHAEASELIRRVASTDPDVQMPPPDSGRKLSARQISLFRQWIEQGAKWDNHWSFEKPIRQKIPIVKSNQEWLRSPIDTLILANLQHEQMSPSADAAKTTLLRRITLDVIGLSPTPDEVSSFLNDQSPDAFERVVDRLLASPHYGERMAVRWLNAARYADTSGYQSDGERTMWRWRDWVIGAFNDNMPFDQFTVEQLAGDQLSEPTLDQTIATGFNRNHRGNAEGGIIPEEYAVEYVVDRVETTATVWLGLTAMCARCHNHKYDPIAQTDFYSLFAFFNNVPEKGRAVKYGNSPPYIVSPTPQQQVDLAQQKNLLDSLEQHWSARHEGISESLSQWQQEGVPAILAAEAVRRRLILHFPFDGRPNPATSIPFQPTRPTGYLGQTRLLAPAASNDRASENGNPKFGPGRFGEALDGDGTCYVAAGDVANFGFFDKFSVSAWIRPKGEQGGTIVSRMTDVNHGDGWSVVLDHGKLQVHLTKRWLDDACRVELAETIPTDEWRHVCVTYDGSREVAGIRVYIDGIRRQTIALLDELNQSFENKGPLRIGAGNGPDGRFHGLIDEVRIFDRALSSEECQILSESDLLSAIASRPTEQQTPPQRAALYLYFIENAADMLIRAAWHRLQAAREIVAKLSEELPTTMVMQDMPIPRETHVLVRGEYDKRGERVSANVPASLPPLPPNEPRNRLGLARWLVAADNPLTSRVAVNRIWQMLFGTGLVKTVDDFGQQGEWPSHPMLLDWMAIEFQSGPSFEKSETGTPSVRAWDIKRMLRLIVTSSTYRQSSQTSAVLQQRDPENRLLARGPRFRLSAEMVRDQALAASGLLVEEIGGPSVKPYQPDGLWKDLAGLDYDQDHGANLYRRSLYTYWKRTVAPPGMITFDAGGRETCIVKETRTNTPLQALNLMNDITYVEAARVLGERMMKEGDKSPSRCITRGFEQVLGRAPQNIELLVLVNGYERHLAYYQSNPIEAKALVKIGETPANRDLDVSELAAYATTASLILNLDETVTRE